MGFKKCFQKLKIFQHEVEVLEACFNLISTKIASCSNHGKAYIYDAKTLNDDFILEGH
jgi:WD40 repeat protein